MRQRLLLLIYIVCILLAGHTSFGQIVGTDVFLQGAYLEIGENHMGAFGTCTSPAGYHPHDFSGTQLGEVYDYGHDGWTVGSPPYMGDYTEPGVPVEGWSVQIAGTEYRNWVNGGTCSGSFDVPGAVTGYSNTGGSIRATWTGAITGLSIIAETRVDTLASAVVVTVRFYNTTASPLTGVYYERMCDPDNGSTWGMGATTNNVIVHQNEDARHEVLVSAVADSGFSPAVYELYTYMGLGTKDCRAKCMYFDEGLPSSETPEEMYSESTSYYYGLNDSGYNDVGYGLVYNLGTIASVGTPGDSAVISFAYIFNTNTGIDSVFPDPQLLVDTTVEPNVPVPFAAHDTFLTCSRPGVTSIPVKLLHATDKNWTWSTWNWAPATGLATTTGVNNTINLTALSGAITYTITGTDSAINMQSCNNKVFYLTVYPCFNASNNGPVCLNDTLKLLSHGDSTGATYIWYGPNGYFSTGQNTFRTGLTLADTGIYHVVKIVGTERDTTTTDVSLTPLPVATLSSNGPVCSGAGNTLNLMATPDSVGETFVWTGPNGFVSGTQNPSIPSPSSLAGTGMYTLVTSFNGCNDTNFINVVVDSTPVVPLARSNAPVCSAKDTLKFSATDATTGVTYAWAGPLSFASTLANPNILPDVHIGATGIYTLTASLTTPDGLTCKSTNSVEALVDSTPYLPLLGSNSPVCTGNPLLLTATSTTGANYNWAGPNSFSSAAQNPTIALPTTPATGIYSVTATIVYAGIPSGCTSDTATFSVVVDSTPVTPVASSNSPGPPGSVICQSDTLRLMASDVTAGVTYSWTGPFGFASTDQNPLLLNTGTDATGTYTVTVSLGGCSAAAVTSVTITPTPPLTATNNGPLCTGVSDTMLLQAYSGPGATYSWAGPYTFSSLNQNPYRTPVIYEYGGVYQVTAFLGGCPSATVNDTVVVRQTPAPPIVPWLTYCQNYSAFPLQAMGDSILWSATDAATDTGTLIPPVPSTSNVGVSWFYTTQTIMGCTSYKDSIKVTVNPKPTVTVSNDTGVCPHDTLVLTAIDKDPLAYYHWSPYIYITDTSSASIVVRPETNVTYTVVATNEFGCTDTAHATVTVQAAAVLNLGADSVTLYPGESYQLQPQTNCSVFSWFPPVGLSDAHISDPLATPQISTIYTVKGSTEWGCTTESSISIYLNSDALLLLPNAFAPGNGPNNEFKIIKRGIVDLQYFRIFDRWGVKVFETKDIEQGWDGTYNGKPQPFGVYVYEVGGTSNTGANVEKHGNVTLLR